MAVRAALTEYLEELGFSLKIDLRENYDPGQRTDYAQYDLIICDLNLPGVQPATNAGQTIVSEIRGFKIYTEVLLYSENANLLKTQFAKLGLIERASFQAGRRNMYEKVVKLIDLTVHKVQTVNNARGLVIAETIDLESKMEQLLYAYFKPSGDVSVDAMKAQRIKKFLKKKSEFIKKNLQLVEGYNCNNLEGFCGQQFLAAFDFILLINGVIQDIITTGRLKTPACGPIEPSSDIQTLATEFQSIQKDVNQIRNTLAHVKEERLDDGSIVLRSRSSNGQGIVFNDEWCKRVRKDLRKHSKNLDGIQSLIIDAAIKFSVANVSS